MTFEAPVIIINIIIIIQIRKTAAARQKWDGLAMLK